MSIAQIQSALEKRLLAIDPPIPTAFENKAFTPVAGEPYQRIHHLLNTPRDMDMSRTAVQERGLLQASLFFPMDVGRLAAMQRAEAIRAQFKPVQVLADGGVRVEIYDTPSIGSGYPDGDRWHVPVTIPWRSVG